MRVLFLSTPLVSHVFPMVPLAWALRAAGHDVLIGTTGPGLSVASAGMSVIDFDPRDECLSIADINAVRPDIVASRATRVADGMPLLLEATRQYADQMIAVSQQWRPDLIVHSQLQGGGPMSAATLGIPAVEHGSSLLRTGDFYERLPELLPAEFAAHALGVTLDRRTALDIAPPSMVTAQPGARPMRYVPFNGGGTLPGELADLPRRPRIAVTVGTNIMAPNMARLLTRTVAAARTVDAEFVLLLSGLSDDVDLGPRLPANVSVVTDWVPLRSILDGCTAIVHHGGAGSTLAALDAGVAQLVVPSGAPNYLQSDAVRDRGAGLTSTPEELDAAVIERVLGDPKIAEAAAEVAAEMAAMPSPVDLVGPLVESAGGPS